MLAKVALQRPGPCGMPEAGLRMQGTRLPCFMLLVERLGQVDNSNTEERLMEHQLFQAIMLAEMEARKAGTDSVLARMPPQLMTAVKKSARLPAQHPAPMMPLCGQYASPADDCRQSQPASPAQHPALMLLLCGKASAQDLGLTG